jgi:chromosome segregation ATPase
MRSMSSSQNKEKIFTEKLAKINKEHGGLEARLKDLHSRKNQAEIRAERAKQDIEELKAKLAKEEESLKKDRETLITLEKALGGKRGDLEKLQWNLKEALAKKREDN